MPEPRGIAFSLSNRRPVLQNDPEYDRLLLALRDEQPEALQDDEIAHLQTLSAPNFRTQNDPVADRARLEPAYQSTMERLLTPGRSEGLPVKRGGSEVAQTMGTLADLFVGPELGSGGPTRDAAAQRVRDRFAAMSPTERVLSGLTERPPTPRAVIPLRENAQTERPMPPTVGQMVVNAGLGALEALDQPPSKMPTGAPYTTPLRLLSASAAVPSALAGLAYDASGQGSVMADAPVVDPLQPADKQSTFSKAIAERGGGKGAQALGFLADLLTPDLTDVLTGGVPLTAMAGGLKNVNTGRKLINGFYSRLDEAASMIPTKGVPATAVLNWLKKAPEGISTEEVVYRKLPEWLKSQGTTTVTPEMLAAYLQANPAPFPQVKTLGGVGSVVPLPEGYRVERLARVRGNTAPGARNNYTLVGPDGSGRAFYATDEADASQMAADMLGLRTTVSTKFNSPNYQVPGGDDYRETLLTLSPQATDNAAFGDYLAKEYGEHMRNANVGAAYRQEFNKSRGAFISPHFDDPNLLVHTRANDRTLPTGERGRFVEEVQSDWHQQAEAKGYQDASKLAAWQQADRALSSAKQAKLNEWDKLKEMSDQFGNPTAANASPELMAQLARWKEASKVVDDADAVYRETGRQIGGVPDAPFKETWPNLGLKQQLIEAANDPKAEWLGFTGGKTQADRYDLSKQVSEINVRPVRMAGDRDGITSGWRVTAKDLTGRNNVITEDIATLDKLPDYIGKDAARVAQQQIESNGTASLTGLNLQVGGEGMRAFYDQKLPKRLEKIVKPFGGAVESGAINSGKSDLEKMRLVYPGEADGDLIEMLRENPNRFTVKDTEPMWFSRLTPEMKDAIKQGLPLLSVLGAAVSAGLLSDAEARQIYRGKPVTGAPQSRKVAER